MGILRKLTTVTGWTMCSRVLGLVRDRLIATSFGAPPLDLYDRLSLPNYVASLWQRHPRRGLTPRYVKLQEAGKTRPTVEEEQPAEAFAGVVRSVWRCCLVRWPGRGHRRPVYDGGAPRTL